MKFCVLLILLMCMLSFQAKDTGHPEALLSDCPGMTHTTSLSEETKRSLSVLIVLPTADLLLPFKDVWCSIEDADCVIKHINLHKVTQVIISGYLDSTFSPLIRSFVAEYLKMKRNVIVLEVFPVLVRSYPLAARITRPLGKLLGKLLASLTNMGVSSKRLELIGASLGAHIASYTAVEYYRLTGRRPARLTALDPAGPCFRNLPVKDRLHADVAEKVDVLHSNIDGMGMAEPLGHVDFYANGGEFQPSAQGKFVLPCFQFCSHLRSGFYYLLAFTNQDKFIGVACDSVEDVRHGNCYEGKIRKNVLGPKTDFNKTGIFYLPTDAVPPFYLGLKGLNKQKHGVNNYLWSISDQNDITL